MSCTWISRTLRCRLIDKIARIARDLGDSSPRHNSSTGFIVCRISLLFLSTSRANVSSILQSDYSSPLTFREHRFARENNVLRNLHFVRTAVRQFCTRVASAISRRWMNSGINSTNVTREGKGHVRDIEGRDVPGNAIDATNSIAYHDKRTQVPSASSVYGIPLRSQSQSGWRGEFDPEMFTKRIPKAVEIKVNSAGS